MVILIISAVMSLVAGKIDKDLCAKSLAETSLLVTAVDSDYPHAHCFGVLYGKVAEAAAGAGQRDPLALV